MAKVRFNRRHTQTLRQVQIEGLNRALEDNKSDPFFFNRAMTHIENGICHPRVADGSYHPRGMPAHYDKGFRP